MCQMPLQVDLFLVRVVVKYENNFVHQTGSQSTDDTSTGLVTSPVQNVAVFSLAF